MAELFKQTTVCWRLDGKRVPAGTPGAVKVAVKSRKWYGTVGGKKTPLSVDKAVAGRMLNRLRAEADLDRAGMADPFADHRRRPLREHLDDYIADLRARGDDARHVSIVASRLRALLAGCGFVFHADVSASGVVDYLARLRRNKATTPLPPGQAWFTPREAAALLGVKPASVGTAARRHRLAGEGHGKRRRFPRETIEALQERLQRGASVETTNQILSHAKAFLRWMVKDHRTPDNPLSHLEAGNTQTDRRHDRRELTHEELSRLLDAARRSTRTYRGLTGWDRFHLYALACGTGFRASALASLTPGSFDLDGDSPTVSLSARRNKSRVKKVQPLPLDVAALMRDYLDGEPNGAEIWGGTWASGGKAAEMLRIDLESANIAYAVDGIDGPLYADFHSLRHTYITLGGRAGIDLRTLQELAGHSTPVLTARYSHRRLYDLAGAIEKMPSFLPSDPTSEPLRATGTDGQTVDSMEKSLPGICRGFAKPDAPSVPSPSVSVPLSSSERVSPETTQPPISQGFVPLPSASVFVSLKGG